TGTLTFTAKNDLIFGATSPTAIRNGQLTGAGAATKWDYVGTAGNDIVMSNGAELTTGLGGSINLTAGNSLRLLPTSAGLQPFLRTVAGGDITLTAMRGDLVASSARQPAGSGPYAGIRLQGPGDLTINVGGDFKGGSIVNGQVAGPGFLLSDGTARVNVGGNIGAPDSYATFTVGNRSVDSQGNETRSLVKVEVTAGKDIYLANVQDKGIAEATVSSVNQQSSASFTSLAGDIHLLPAESTGRPLTRILPPSFNVNSQTGNIFVHGDLDFWPSPVRHITFSAGNSITGVATNSNLIPQIGL